MAVGTTSDMRSPPGADETLLLQCQTDDETHNQDKKPSFPFDKPYQSDPNHVCTTHSRLLRELVFRWYNINCMLIYRPVHGLCTLRLSLDLQKRLRTNALDWASQRLWSSGLLVPPSLCRTLFWLHRRNQHILRLIVPEDHMTFSHGQEKNRGEGHFKGETTTIMFPNNKLTMVR